MLDLLQGSSPALMRELPLAHTAPRMVDAGSSSPVSQGVQLRLGCCLTAGEGLWDWSPGLSDSSHTLPVQKAGAGAFEHLAQYWYLVGVE